MTPASRNNQLRQIKAAARTLFARDEEGERALYLRLTGTAYCRCMTDAQLRQVGDYLARASGHKPDKKVSLRPNSSLDLVARLEAFRARPAPAGWDYHPLDTRMLWRRATGSENAVPFAHLDRAQQSRLHRSLISIYKRADAAASGAAPGAESGGASGGARAPRSRRRSRSSAPIDAPAQAHLTPRIDHLPV